MKDLFLLDPSVIFLNHGSFGACPRAVFEEYQRWQLELERQPVEFMIRRRPELLRASRSALAEFVGCDPDEIVYVANATTAVNTIARSLDLKPGDEILTTDLEYGALDRVWSIVCAEAGAVYRRASVSLPVTTSEAFVEEFTSQIGPSTRLIFVSHITSATGLVLPVREVIEEAKRAGVPVFVDGAHVPGQLDLDLSTLGADFYTGNCHKWMLTPKGSAFLYARRLVQDQVRPLIVSWGSMSVDDSRFIQEIEYQGTRDVAAYLTIPAAIRFLEEHDWDRVRGRCRKLALEVRALFVDIFGGRPLAPADGDWYAQLVAHEIFGPQCPLLQAQLYDQFRIEIPVTEQNGRWFIRASIQAYSDARDIDKLGQALRALWPAIDG